MTMNDVDKLYKKNLLENDVKENELLFSYKKTSKEVAARKSAKFGHSLKHATKST